MTTGRWLCGHEVIRLVLSHLRNIPGSLLDPLQFSYRANRSMQSAWIPELITCHNVVCELFLCLQHHLRQDHQHNRQTLQAFQQFLTVSYQCFYLPFATQSYISHYINVIVSSESNILFHWDNKLQLKRVFKGLAHISVSEQLLVFYKVYMNVKSQSNITWVHKSQPSFNTINGDAPFIFVEWHNAQQAQWTSAICLLKCF